MKQKRKQLIVSPKVQYKIVLLICISIVIPSVLLGGSVIYNLKLIQGLLVDSTGLAQVAIQSVITKIFMILMIGMPAIVMLIICWSIVVTNRLTGPIYRLENELDKIIKTRQFQEIHFRKHDAFHSLAEKMNLLLKGLYVSSKNGSEFISQDTD